MPGKEVLSQAEIDMLLTALASGDVNPDEIRQEATQPSGRRYDFRRPNKFSKDQLRTLFMIHDSFARVLSNFLSVYLRTNVQIKIVSVDQITYDDFIVSIPSPTLMTVFTLPPLKGTAIMETNPAFVFPMIDLLFGGRGDMPDQVRELTDIEIGVLRKLNDRILQNLAGAWQDIFPFQTNIETMETNPQFSQVFSPNETVAVITLTTTIGEEQGLINLCLPFVTLETLVPKLSAHYWFAGQEQGAEEDARYLIQRLEEAPVEIRAVCGQSLVSVRDLLQLAVGDVVLLDRYMGENMDLFVEDKLKLKIQPGVLGRNLGVRVTRRAVEEKA